MLIKHIDQIAREKKRGVVFLSFETDEEIFIEWETHSNRIAILSWLESQGILFSPCAHFASENSIPSYNGEIYIDVSFDENDKAYQKLRDYLENPDGSMRLSDVNFWYLPLENAIKNAHHDGPEFWDNWAAEF